MSDEQMSGEVMVLKEQMRQVIMSQAEMKIVNASQSAKLDTIVRQLDRADGGWKAIMWLGGAVGAISAGVVSWIAFFTHK